MVATISKPNPSILMEMHRRMDEWRVLSQKVGSLDLYPHSTLLPGEIPTGVNPREARLVGMLTGYYTVEELAVCLGKPVLSVAKDLYGLVMAGHAAMKGVRSGRRPEAAGEPRLQPTVPEAPNSYRTQALDPLPQGWPEPRVEARPAAPLPSLPSLPPPVSRAPIALRSSPTEKCGPSAATTTARTSLSPESTAMARGRSRHRSTPMALRASGRSSHRVATPSSPASMRSTGDSKSTISPMWAKANAPGREASGWPVECMGRIGDPERGRTPAHLHR